MFYESPDSSKTIVWYLFDAERLLFFGKKWNIPLLLEKLCTFAENSIINTKRDDDTSYNRIGKAKSKYDFPR